MSDVNKTKHDAADLFGYWAETDNGEDVWARKSEDEIMDDLGIDRDDPRNENRFETAVAKIDDVAPAVPMATSTTFALANDDKERQRLALAFRQAIEPRPAMPAR